MSFAKKFSELENLVDEFEEGDLDLDTDLQRFEKGLKLAAELKSELDKFSLKIDKIKNEYEVD